MRKAAKLKILLHILFKFHVFKGSCQLIHIPIPTKLSLKNLFSVLFLATQSSKVDLTLSVSSCSHKGHCVLVASTMIDQKTIRSAFVAVASAYPWLRHGRWIPVTYRVIKVNKKLPNDQRILTQKLISSLEKLNAINRCFDSSKIQTMPCIRSLYQLWQLRDVFVEWKAGGNPTRVTFACVVTAEAPEEALPTNDTDRGNFFRGRYAQYQHCKRVLMPRTPLIASSSFLPSILPSPQKPCLHQD